ncbi:MAG: preprotein translocase subunit SecA [Chloroflexi bacterium]|nr:preprotein translocase subunit SecA [Chloroflexota bacterium]
MLKWLTGLKGRPEERVAHRLQPLVQAINQLEPDLQQLTDEQLCHKTAEFRERLAKGEALDDLLPEAFAAVREAARRTIGLRHFDVQLMGGVVLHQGKIAEMKTGEGKTLVATLPLYLNALEGKGTHLVTVNDYLARRDTQWMGPVFHALGLTVGCLQHETAYLFDPTATGDNPSLRHLRPVPRREAYGADVTYGTNHEFGFDYLRDNMVLELAQKVQRELHYAIVDEVDYILIDEARTPLIISGPAQESTQLYAAAAKLAPRLQREADFAVDEKHRTLTLAEDGIAKVEKSFNIANLYDPNNYVLSHYVENAIRALVFYQRDRDYVVKDGEVVIVDEFTGRMMPGRRWSDGLHQAIEAKEGLKVQQETITYATITLQNYFRMYHKLAGMTGTALTAADEFMSIYRLDGVPIPTHRPMVRQDQDDLVYKTEDAKWRAMAEDIVKLHQEGRPVLVGTTSIEKSERLSELLKRRGVPHQVLNAKLHEKEALIVAQAGHLGGVTVATNMAGRGTDIILGGNLDGLLQEELRKRGFTLDTAPKEVIEDCRERLQRQWDEEHRKVVELGGLHVIGTEKHEARRIDNQLRGRAGRQGDPGSSQFFVSLEDDLMRRFGGERIKTVMNWAGIPDDQPIKNTMVSKAIENAQVRVEAYNFEIRKHLVDYDDVVNRHRDVIYVERNKVLIGADLKGNIQGMVERELQHLLATYVEGHDPEHWNLEGLEHELKAIFPLPAELEKEQLRRLSRDEMEQHLLDFAKRLYQQREESMEPQQMRLLERVVLLRTIDSHWVEHLTTMEGFRQGVGLEAAGQRDPLVAYRTRGHEMFQELLARIQHDVARTIYHASLVVHPQQGTPARPASRVRPSPMAAVARSGREAVAAGGRKVGRNEPCPCGSGKKYKKCHGASV